MAKVTANIICNYAEVRGGLLYVMSGGLTRMIRPEVPAPLGAMLAVMVEIPYDETYLVHELSITVRQVETAAVVGRVSMGFQLEPVDLNPGESVYYPVAVHLEDLSLPALGQYDLTAAVDGTPGVTTSTYVVLG